MKQCITFIKKIKWSKVEKGVRIWFFTLLSFLLFPPVPSHPCSAGCFRFRWLRGEESDIGLLVTLVWEPCSDWNPDTIAFTGGIIGFFRGDVGRPSCPNSSAQRPGVTLLPWLCYCWVPLPRQVGSCPGHRPVKTWAQHSLGLGLLT